MTWKYGMIKVGETIDYNEEGNQLLEKAPVCELVELYQDEKDEWTSFTPPIVSNPKALKMALNDVERDGINTWFWDSGTFTWNHEERFWDWKKND